MTRADQLTSQQRKALRRLGRGQTIPRSMWDDPVIRRCYSTAHYTPPPNLDGVPYPQSMFDYCDWEERASRERPRLTDFGFRLLSELSRDS